MKKVLKLIFSRTVIMCSLIALQAYWFIVLFYRLSEHAIWIDKAFDILSLVMMLAVIISDQNPAYKIGWIVLIGLIPLLGGILYVLISNKKPSRKLRTRLQKAQRQLWEQVREQRRLVEVPDKRIQAFSDYISTTGPYYMHKNTKAKYFPLGEEMFKSMLEDLEKAEKFIFFEYFIVGEGTMWQQIRRVLIDKAHAGVDVRVMYDDFGCIGTLPKDFKKDLTSHGIKVVAFNPLVPFLALVMNNRDHRKILVIDGNVGYNGGINIADEYINAIDRCGHWKDTGVRLEGDAVLNLTIMFLSMWNAYHSENTDLKDYMPNISHEDADGYIQPFSDSPLDNETVSENLYMDILYNATDYVYIFTPYLIIDNEMAVALTMAAKRGVDVRIVVPGIPDKKTVYHLTQSYFRQLLEGGVRIYKYSPGFIHAKSYVSDDKVAVVGTINMDYRSLYLHFECGCFIVDKKQVIDDLKNDAFDTFAKCEEVTMDSLNKSKIFNLYQAVLRVMSPLF